MTVTVDVGADSEQAFSEARKRLERDGAHVDRIVVGNGYSYSMKARRGATVHALPKEKP